MSTAIVIRIIKNLSVIYITSTFIFDEGFLWTSIPSIVFLAKLLKSLTTLTLEGFCGTTEITISVRVFITFSN